MLCFSSVWLNFSCFTPTEQRISSHMRRLPESLSTWLSPTQSLPLYIFQRNMWRLPYGEAPASFTNKCSQFTYEMFLKHLRSCLVYPLKFTEAVVAKLDWFLVMLALGMAMLVCWSTTLVQTYIIGWTAIKLSDRKLPTAFHDSQKMDLAQTKQWFMCFVQWIDITLFMSSISRSLSFWTSETLGLAL